jgi:hypothetical protein
MTDVDYLFPAWAQPYVDAVPVLVFEQIAADETSRAFRHVLTGMTVIVSGLIEADGKPWLHVSCAYHNRLPSWDDLKLVKEAFIGKDKQAVQIFPGVSKYVNFHPNCLHLWHCASRRGDGLPDFTVGRPEGLI